MRPTLSALLLLAAAPAAAQSWGGVAWCEGTAAVASAHAGRVTFVTANSFAIEHHSVPFAGPAGDRRELAWAPGCERVAVIDPEAITVLTVADGSLQRMERPDGLAGVFGYERWNQQPSVAWSPSGQVLAAHLVSGPPPFTGRALVRFDAETGAATRLALPADAVPHVFAMVDDEIALVAFGEPLQIRRVNARRSRTLARGLQDVRMAGQPPTIVGTRGGPRGSLRIVAIHRRSGRQRMIRAGLYTFHGLSDDGSTVLVDDHLMHLATGERTRLHAFAVRGRAHQTFAIDTDRDQGSPDWTWDSSGSRVVGNPHPNDTRFGSGPVSHRQPTHTHFVVDDGSGPPPLVFRAGTEGDAGPWVNEHRVSTDGRWDLFLLTRNGTPPSCPNGEHGFRVRRELLLVPLGPGQPRRHPLDERARCRRIPID